MILMLPGILGTIEGAVNVKLTFDRTPDNEISRSQLVAYEERPPRKMVIQGIECSENLWDGSD